MKINEKNLVSFAVSNQSIDKEGWLTKRSDYGRNVQKRWFVLKGNLLFYFDKSGDKEPLGVIVLEGCTVELVDDELYSFKIDFQGSSSRSYYLGAESQEIMEQWMKAIACAGYDYMKIMVEQLKQQLKELEDKTMQLVSVDSSPIPPPRSRQNPFNKPETSNYSRSLSVTSTDSTSSSLMSSKSTATSSTGIVKSKALFREIHLAIGRPILLDFNNWKHTQQKNAPPSDDLIIL